jgi:hypothetical protein
MGGQARRSFGQRWSFVVASVAMLAAIVLPVGGASGGSRSASLPRGATSSGQAKVGTVGPGIRVRATPTATPARLTREQREQIREGMAESEPTPNFPIYQGPLPRPAGPGMSVTRQQPQAPALPLFRDSKLDSGGLRSPVGEPSTDANGKYVFNTGNWYASYSYDNGSTWAYLNPFTMFGISGFCCDQVTVLDATHNRQFWLLQFGDRLVIANSSGRDLQNWCFYSWFPSQFGLSGGFDYNHLAVSTNFLYATTDSAGGALVWRMPIDAQAQCGGFGFSYVVRNTEFADAFVQGVGDTMYWGSDWTNIGLGNGFRVLRWADNSGTYFTFDRSIDAFAFMTVNSGQNCTSTNAVVLNWCQRTDSRMSGGGYLALPSLAQSNTGGSPENDAVVGFAFNAKQDGSHAYPYIRRIYFRQSDLAYFGYSEIWSSVTAILYPDMAPDSRGHVGIIWAWGGGTSPYYPGAGLTLDSDVSPTQPWNYDFFLYGAGNPCLNPGDNYRRWGDYLTVRPWSPPRNLWIGTAFALKSNAGACNNTADVVVHNIVFGDTRDIGAYKRWKSK